MIKSKQFLFRSLLLTIVGLLFSVQSFAQAIDVKGVVTDQNGLSIIGAAVIEKGTNNGATTDIDGAFHLNAKKGAVIEISYLGYATLEMPASANMKVVLAEDTQVLDDVVVIGYGVVRKKEVTGAVSQVKAEDLSKQITSDLGSALQGMVSGVSVTSESSAPGAGSTILIRGVSSLKGGNTPLYVVDGVPQEGDPRISPNEVETMDILKDAASCAIYGTRGAAGVILITTKKGKEGKLRVNATANYGVKTIMSDYNFMNATEQTYFNLAYQRSIKDYTITDELLPLDLERATSYFYNDTALYDQIFINNAATQDYTATLSGGSKGFTYSIMGGYYNQEGSVRSSGFNRLNTRANLNYKADKLTVSASFGLSREDTDYTPAGLLLQSIKYFPTQTPITSGTYYANGGDEQTHISHILSAFNTEDEQILNNSFVNLNASYEILKHFNISGRVAYNRTDGYRRGFRPYQKIINIDGDETSSPEDSYVSMQSINRNSVVWDFGAQYQQSFNKHKVSAMVTATGEQYNSVGFVARKEGVLDNDIKVLNGASINPSATSTAQYTNKLIGTIGRVQYDWASRYLVSASLRVDGSSKFVKSNRWGVFPSASAAWNVSEEPFFRPVTSVVNNMKIRASYGTTGNQSFGAYSYAASITNGLDYINGAGVGNLVLGSAQTSYANPDVKWETSKQVNFGVDLGFFENKLTVTAEYYQTEKEDMLFPIKLPGSNGTNAAVVLNVGNMTNSGYELAVQYRNSIGKLKYSANATFSTNENMITKINGEGARFESTSTGLIAGADGQSKVSFIAEGYPAGALFLYPTNGIITTDEQLAEYRELNSTAKMGDLMYVDTDGDGTLFSNNDRQYMGNGIPKYEIGFNLNLDYHNFDLYVNLFSALGHELINGSKATAYTYGRHKDLLGVYSPSNTDSPLPTYRGSLTSHNNYRADSDMFLEDASYMKVKNITLGYTIPSSVLEKVNIQRLRVYVSAQNLFTLTNYTGFDPEVGGGIATRGMDYGNYPALTTFMAGLNISF